MYYICYCERRLCHRLEPLDYCAIAQPEFNVVMVIYQLPTVPACKTRNALGNQWILYVY